VVDRWDCDWRCIVITIFLIFMAGLADRLRGDAFDIGNRSVDKLIYGWVIAAILAHPLDALTAPIAFMFAIGCGPGWWNPARPKWWQPKNEWLGHITRGVIWGLPLAPLAYFDVNVLAVIPAYAIAVPIGFLINRKADWEKMEFCRGWIAASIIALVVNL
jgi:hypothetical protein